MHGTVGRDSSLMWWSMANGTEQLQGATRDPAISVPAGDPGLTSAPAEASAAGIDLSLKELERRHIEQVVADSQTLVEAAARLGIDTATLWRKRKRYGMK